MRRTKKVREQERARRVALRESGLAILATGKCPICGSPFRRNLALSGWYQCSQFGAVGFRADSTKPSCDYQIILPDEERT